MPSTNFPRLLLAVFLGLTLPGVLHAAPAADSELAGLTIKAEQGNAIAQYNLGLAYAEGQGVARDPMEAFVWLSIALENGARGRALDGIIARMNAAELAQGRQLLAQRRAALGLIPAPVPTVAPTATPDTAKVVDAAEQLRRERDALSLKLTELVGEIAALRDERDRSQTLAIQSKQEATAARLLSETVQTSAQDAARRTIELQQQIAQLEVAAAQPIAYPDLRERVTSLEAEIATVRATPPPFADQREQVVSLEAQLATATQQADDHEARLTELSAANRTIASELDALRVQLAERSQRAEAAQAEANRLRTENSALTAAASAPRETPAPAYPDLRERVAELEAEIATVRATPPPFADQRAQVQSLEAQLATAREQVATSETRAAALNDAHRGVESELQALTARLTRLQQQSDAAEAEAAQLRAVHDAAAVQTQTAISEANALNRAAQENVRQAETRIAELTQQVAQLQAATAAQVPAPTYPDLRDRVTELEAEIATVRATPPPFADQRAQVQTLEAQLAAAAQETVTNEARFATLHEAKAAVDSELQTVRTQLALGLQQVDEAQEHVRLAEGRVAELRQQLAQAPTAAPTEQPAAPAYPDLRERVSELEAQVVTLRDAPAPGADLREQVQALEAQLASAQQQLATSEKRFAAFAEAKNGVDAELQAVRAQLANRQQPVAPSYPDLRERVSDLEAQVVALRDAPPAFSDQRAQVQDLETQLAQALQQVSTGASRIAALTAAQSGTGLELETMRSHLTSSQQQADAAQAAANKLLAENRTLVAAAAAPRETPAPTYPDLRDRVAELESQLAGVAPAPAEPNLQPQVAALEAALATTRAELDAARAAASVVPVAAAPAPDLTDKLEDAETRLAISLRSFLQLQREHDALLGRTNQAANEKSTERDNLTARLAGAEAAATAAQAESTRLGQALAALQRSGTQAGSEAAELRALLVQVQGANDVLARENYELKTARAPAPLPVPGAAPVVTADRVHTVAPADTLSLISNRYYGTPGRWQEIFNANRDVIDAQGTLRVGMKLRIP